MIGDEGVPEFDYAMLKFGTDHDGTSVTGENFTYAINYAPGWGDDWATEYVGDTMMENAAHMNQAAADLGIAASGLGINDYTSMCMVIELYNEQEELIYTSRLYTFNDYQNHIGSGDYNATWRSPDYLIITEFNPPPIPEPNSAILLLIGASLLSLRRKR